MSTGKIKFYNSQKAFGFAIDHDTDEEIFVHISGLKNRKYEPRENDEVSFDIIDGKKGPNAVNVEKI